MRRNGSRRFGLLPLGVASRDAVCDSDTAPRCASPCVPCSSSFWLLCALLPSPYPRHSDARTLYFFFCIAWGSTVLNGRHLDKHIAPAPSASRLSVQQQQQHKATATSLDRQAARRLLGCTKENRMLIARCLWLHVLGALSRGV